MGPTNYLQKRSVNDIFDLYIGRSMNPSVQHGEIIKHFCGVTHGHEIHKITQMVTDLFLVSSQLLCAFKETVEETANQTGQIEED